MSFGKSTYILKYEGPPLAEMLVVFDNNQTAGANLDTVLPAAIERGFIPHHCRQCRFELEHQKRLLSRDLPLSNQGVRDHETLILRDLSNSVKINVSCFPDNVPGVIETITADPTQELRPQVDAQLLAKLKPYRFYGRRLKKYQLFREKKKLDLKATLRSLDMHSDFTTLMKPRVWFEWPPRLLWPPGPYTTYVIVLSCMVLVALTVYWIMSRPQPETSRMVQVHCLSPCKIYDGQEHLLGVTDYIDRLSAGEHKLAFYHADFPVFDTTIMIDPKTIPPNDTLVLTVDATSRFRNKTKVELRVSGFDSDQGDRVYLSPSPLLLINRFAVNPDTILSHRLFLPTGIYEIRYDLPNNHVQDIKFNGMKIMRRDFRFDLGESPSENRTHIPLSFWYATNKKRGSHAGIN